MIDLTPSGESCADLTEITYNISSLNCRNIQFYALKMYCLQVVNNIEGFVFEILNFALLEVLLV